MPMKTFDDELDETTPAKQQPQAQPAAAAAAAATATATAPAPTTAAKSKSVEDDEPAKAAAAAADDDNLDTDFDDEKVYARPGQLNQVRPDKGKAVRFAFLPKSWIAPQTAKSHFVEVGSGKDIKQVRARCLTPMGAEVEQQYCCEALGKDGDVEVVALVIHYTNADPVTGKYEKDPRTGEFPPIKWEIGFVRLSQFNMKQIKKLPDEDSDPFKIDLVMTHADRAFGYEFNRKSNVPRWTLNDELVAEVKAAAQRYVKDGGKALKSKLGQKLNEIEWKALLSGKKVGQDAKIDNVDEL